MSAPHPLDRPVWNALTGRQAAMASRDGDAVRMAPDIGVFAATGETSAAALGALVPLAEGGLATIECAPLPAPPGLAILRQSSCHQMLAPALAAAAPDFAFAELTPDDAPAMLALATLTEPGPFRIRTGALGRFVGVKADGRLVAMAGERLKPDGHTEVSGVCTHPDFRGRGYAAGLMRDVAARILARGETPILHAYSSNSGAIALYERLGFRLRRRMILTMLAPAG